MNELCLDYSYVRSKIKYRERVINILFIMFVGVWHTLAIYFMIVQAVVEWKYRNGNQISEKDYLHWKIVDKAEYAMEIILLLVTGIMVMIEIVLYWSLMKVMKAQLHGFYIKKKKDIKLLLKISTIWLSLYLIAFIVGEYLIIDFNESAYLGNYSEISRASFYIQIVCRFSGNLPLNLYAIMTIKNIDFKLYMCYIFLGIEMIEELKEASTFLFGKPKIVYDEDAYDKISNSESIDLSPELRRKLSESFERIRDDYITENGLPLSHRSVKDEKITISKSAK